MGWPLIAAGIMGAGQVFSGVSSFLQGNSNARAAEAYANWNATNLMVFGAWQADAIEKFSHFNAGLILRGAAANASNAISVANYNADLQDIVAEHNTSLLMDEASGIWEAEKLDEKLLEQKVAQVAGEQVAAYAGSNVITNEGTPLEAVIDTKTQGEFEKHIMRFNANEQARVLLNAATQGEWEAEIAGEQMIYEAEVAGMNSMNSARVTAAGMLAQGKYDSMMTKWSAMQDAQKTLMDGQWQASQYRKAGTQALISGLFGAASSGITAYGQWRAPNTSLFSMPGIGGYSPSASNTGNFLQNYNFGLTPTYSSLLGNDNA